ncbi:MAG TPA: GHMP kinase [Planctomycetota bacterium]|nr:GHMP kinase [Planctomycetota bacterium]
MIIQTRAFARAGLIGNPSDGYFGKTISIIIRNFAANVTLWESPELEIVPGANDGGRYASLDELLAGIRTDGYYGGVRLIKAITRRFALYCRQNGLELEPKNFTVRCESEIPRRVGMAGSSAIVTATLRALMRFYEVSIPLPVQPGLILSAERDELGIGAGLQDRVIQTYEGAVYMDFDPTLLEKQGYGQYEPLDPALLPPLFIAYDTSLSEGSEVFHNNIRERFDRGDRDVADAMRQFADLAEQARQAMLAGRPGDVGPLMSRNFDLRRSLYRLSARNIEMIEIARRLGAHAKFAGSGGAAIGTYADEAAYEKLAEAYRAAGFEIFKPKIE